VQPARDILATPVPPTYSMCPISYRRIVIMKIIIMMMMMTTTTTTTTMMMMMLMSSGYVKSSPFEQESF